MSASSDQSSADARDTCAEEERGSAFEDRTRGLAPGRYRRLRRLSDPEGRFSMLAVDQRGSLRRMLARRTNGAPEDVPDGALRTIKRAVTATVAPLASAVLTDPIYGYPASIDAIARDTGVLLSTEQTGYRGVRSGERLSRLLEDWSVERAVRSGADAAKLLIYHSPEVAPETIDHQREIVETVGRACEREEMPFVLEAVTYDPEGSGERAFAEKNPELVADAARTYSDPRFGVDVLKVEFPAALGYAEEYGETPFGRDVVLYDREAVEAACAHLDEAAGTPWVILSAGVDVEEFAENLRIADEAGASGFLCGRAVWKSVVDRYPDVEAMSDRMRRTGRANFRRLLEVNDGARPWFEHPRFEA